MAKNGDDATSVTLELDILDCSVCWEPLQPPVFQVHRIFVSPNIHNVSSLFIFQVIQ
jgi:hypothetical protein